MPRLIVWSGTFVFPIFLLYCFRQLQGDRTISSIFHLLTGKRSTQTLQDAKLFRLENYFGIYPTLERSQYLNVLRDLNKQEYITVSDQQVILTSKGESYLEHYAHMLGEIKHLNGYRYSTESTVFWERLLLYIQTVSNLLYNENRFLPIIESEPTIQWVKKYYYHHKNHLKDHFHALYEDIVTIFSKLPSNHRDIMTSCLSGYQLFGKTKSQLADSFHLTEHDIHLIMENSLHFMLRDIWNEKESYRVIKDFIPIKRESSKPLTESAQITLKYLENGFSIKEISFKRNLKISTIQDHIVEIAVMDSEFPITTFVSEDLQQIIIEVIKKMKTRRLKVIKEALPPMVDYFMIRLVLAKYDGK